MWDYWDAVEVVGLHNHPASESRSLEILNQRVIRKIQGLGGGRKGRKERSKSGNCETSRKKKMTCSFVGNSGLGGDWVRGFSWE